MSNYNTTLQSNNTDLQAILNTINELPEAGVGEQATPVISVNTSGLITATAGTKSSTHQLAFQPAKTITPTTTSQIAVSSGYYTGGNVTVAGDANLVAGNIKSGVNIFGVSGTYVGSGGSSGGASIENDLITGTIKSYTNNIITTIRPYAFAECRNLTSVSFPVCTFIRSSAFLSCVSLTSVSFPVCKTIGDSAFFGCIKLTSVSFPVCTSISGYAFTKCISLTTVNFPSCTFIGERAFSQCTSLTSVSFPACTSIAYNAFDQCNKLTSVSFPACTSIGDSAFARCRSLTTVNFPACTSIKNGAFDQCTRLTKIYLTASSRCILHNSNAFSGTGIWSNKGSIFVKSSLVASYKTATNWVFFSNRIYSA